MSADIEVSVDGTTHVIPVEEIAPHLDPDVPIIDIPASFVDDVQRAVDSRTTLSPPPEDPTDADADSDPDPDPERHSVDDELEFQAKIDAAERVLAERAYQLAAEDYAHEPVLAEQDYLDAQRDLETARLAAGASIADWMTRVALRERRRRFASIIEVRRKELRLSREQLASLCGLSGSTIKNLETSSNPDRVWNQKTRTAIEAAFQWQPGSFEIVLGGGDPTPLPAEQVPLFPSPTSATYGRPTPEPDPRLETIRAGVRVAMLRVEQGLADRAEELAISEDRNINDILEDALDLYWRIKGPRPDAR